MSKLIYIEQDEHYPRRNYVHYVNAFGMLMQAPRQCEEGCVYEGSYTLDMLNVVIYYNQVFDPYVRPAGMSTTPRH